MSIEEKDSGEEFGGEMPVTHGVDKEELDIEIIDDTPPADRNRKPMKEPVDDITDDELDAYDEKIQKRMKKMTRGYHDERRAKEAAARERDEALQFAQSALNKARQLEQQLADGSQVYISKSLSEAETLLSSAKQEYRTAYDSGDADKLVEAQEKMTQATISLEQAKRLKPLTVTPEQSYSPPQKTETAKPTDRDLEWAEKNEWFGTNTRMTALVHGIHAELVAGGLDPRADPETYYQRIDAGMRESFPQYFKAESDKTRENANTQRARPDTVVAAATRGSAPKKVTLTSTQVALAKKLGIPLEAYAREVAKLDREVR